MDTPEDRDIDPVSVDPADFDEPLPGPEHADPSEIPEPANELQQPEPEPPHLELGSPHADSPGPRPYDEPNPEIP
jgi:hypothetical protein